MLEGVVVSGGEFASGYGQQNVLVLCKGSGVEEERLEGLEVQGRPHGVPLASGFGIGPPRHGSTTYRRAIQVP